jgi:fructose-bisphosphate aldolase class II
VKGLRRGTVILHTDYYAKSLLPWIDGLMAVSEPYHALHGEPLFSSHMIDLSEEPLEENIAIRKDYLARMSKVGMLLEMELGITGGKENSADNTDVTLEDLYSKPEEIYEIYKALTHVLDMFTVATASGNVHGVYSPGNVKLKPKILERAQAYIANQLGDAAPANAKPVNFVFHGGSGSALEDIRETPTRNSCTGTGSRASRPSTARTSRHISAPPRGPRSPTRTTTTPASACGPPRWTPWSGWGSPLRTCGARTFWSWAR